MLLPYGEHALSIAVFPAIPPKADKSGRAMMLFPFLRRPSGYGGHVGECEAVPDNVNPYQDETFPSVFRLPSSLLLQPTVHSPQPIFSPSAT